MSASVQNRDAILLARRGGATIDEIAVDLKISRNVVAGVLDRARKAGLSAGPTGPLPQASKVSKPRARSRPARKATPVIVAKDRAAPPADDRPLPPQSLEQVQKTGGCRWPSGDPKAAGFGFCGRRREQSDLPFDADPAPYCGDHRAASASGIQASARPLGWWL